MNLSPLHDLVAEWREEAARLRRRGAEASARALESAADDLEETLDKWWTEPLTLSQAATESGYSVDHLQHVCGEKIPNAGEKGAPRIRRCDLPRKPEPRCPEPADGDLADRVLAKDLS